jgi:hypothetical protein
MNTLTTLDRFCKSWVLLILYSGAGCVTAMDEQTDTGEPVGHVEQAFSGYWGFGWQTDNQSTPPLDLGPDGDRTCFLSGVGGVLKSEYGSFGPPGNIPTTAAARTYRSAGRWWLSTHGNRNGIRVKATAICLPTVANRTAQRSWAGWFGQQAVDLGPATTYRKCGLTDVSNTQVYYADNVWQASTDSVQVWQAGGRWYLGGTGNAQGAAVCVDTTHSGYWSWQLGSGTSTATWNLLQHVDHGTSPLGAQCFLMGVGGAFQENDWGSGVFVNYDQGSTWWSLAASPQKTGWVMCVK